MRRSITKEEEQNSTGSMEDTNRQQDLDSAAQFFASESTRTSTMNQEKPNAGSELRGSPTANDDDDEKQQHEEQQQQQQQQEPPSAEPVVAPSTRSSQATNSATRFFETMQSEKQQQQQSNSSSNLRNRRKNSNSNLENSNNNNNNVNATTTSNKNNNNNYRDSVLTGDYTEYNDADDDHDRLLACCSHPSSCYEAMVCMPCFIQRQLTALDQSSSSSSTSNKNDNDNDNDNDEEGSGSENAPWIFYCVSWFFVVPALRHEVNSRFGKQDGCCFDFFAGVFCPHLSLAQTHRQLCYLGSAPKGWFLEPYHNQRMV